MRRSPSRNNRPTTSRRSRREIDAWPSNAGTRHPGRRPIARIWLAGVVAAVLAVGIALPGGHTPRAAAATHQTWLFFGDSITMMTADPGPGSFGDRLQTLVPGLTITQYNEGIGGIVAGDSAPKFLDALARHPDATHVAIALGTNDGNGTIQNGNLVCWVQPAAFYTGYTTMIDATLAAGKIPVVPTMPSAIYEPCGRLMLDQLTRIYDTYGTRIMRGPDLWNHFWVGPSGTTTDRTAQQKQWFPDIHPSLPDGVDEYHRYWADTIATRLTGVTPTALAPGEFVDVPPSSAFHGDISWVALRGIATGWPDGTFRPGLGVTREAMAAFLYRLAGSPPVDVPAGGVFADVPADHQFAREIAWMVASGISTGWPDHTFRPGTLVTRAATAAFLFRLAGRPTSPTADTPFTDVAPTDRFAQEIGWMAASGISTGWPDGTFRPGNPVRRDAMAAFIHRFAT
jgi:lysophospholipase L1-like esterase